MSDSVQPHRRQPTRLHHPWDSPGKNTGVGCHFLLQCMKVKSQSEVAQSCPTLCDPRDCSLPGSSVHGIFQAGVLEWVAIAFSAKYVWRDKQFLCRWRSGSRESGETVGREKGPWAEDCQLFGLWLFLNLTNTYIALTFTKPSSKRFPQVDF